MPCTERPLDDSDPNALTIGQARARILETIAPVTDSESVATVNALGRILATFVDSPMNVPSFRAAAMDGYALRYIDVDRPLTITGRSLAGHPGEDSLAAGTCRRITTGARVPDDADTVVQQENTRREGDSLHVTVRPESGLHVRTIGSDSQQGKRLLENGTRLGPSELAVLAAHGITHVVVYRSVRVALFSTGDELVEPGTALGDGQIYDANRALLVAMLADPTIVIDDLGICRDSPDDLAAVLVRAASADLVVSSGGVSVGEADHVRAVVERVGTIGLWKIAMKPGRPLTFGTTGPDQWYFGLPGNPVSAAITALMFVRPALKRLLGMDTAELPSMTAKLNSRLRKLPGRVEYQRGYLSMDADGNAIVTTTGVQDSHVLMSLQRANALIELSSSSSGAETGDTVAVYPFTHFSPPLL